MATQLDLDDVAATSELANKQLADLYEEIGKYRNALHEAREYMCDGMSSYKWMEAFKIIANALDNKE
jgi:hypothetical protein